MFHVCVGYVVHMQTGVGAVDARRIPLTELFKLRKIVCSVIGFGFELNL